MSQSLSDLDPTGTLNTAKAAVGLVGAVARTVPALKNASNAVRNQSGSSKGPEPLHRAQTSTEAPPVVVDPAQEKRAYEAVNLVLRELGSRICAAGLVNEHALGIALTAATQQVNLFSGQTNRLFASIAGDPLLVNAVFTSIYFIGALTAELSHSLPNYKETHPPLGPWIVQQLFRTAIGEDAFRDNLTANLDAYKTVAATAGLLRPTDIGYSTFPGLPHFSPTRYSSRAFGDVRNHKSIFDKLVKHFDKNGFPQPSAQKQGEVGLISDWGFLAGDSPSRYYDVERADKNIGQTFGSVLHWLICSADRLQPGQAVIAYYLQHIELIKWIGQRMGYSILYCGTDFNMAGAHSKLDSSCRAVFNTWVILMPSESARVTRRTASANWMQTHKVDRGQISPLGVPQPQPQQQQQQRYPVEIYQNAGNAPIVVPVVQSQTSTIQAPAPQAPQIQNLPSQAVQFPSPNQTPLPQSGTEAVSQSMPRSLAPGVTSPPPKTIDEKLDDIGRDIREVLIPKSEKLISAPPADPNIRLFEYRRLTQHIEKNIIIWLDGYPIPEDHPARIKKKALIIEAQQILQSLDIANRPPSGVSTPSIASTPSVASPSIGAGVTPAVTTPSAITASPIENSSISTAATSPPLSPSHQLRSVSLNSLPPYSPTTPSSTSIHESTSNPAAYPFPAKKTARRKAPPPPKKFISAKAMYDFVPEDDNDEELAIKEGDDIEIIEKTAALEEEGWCRARVKGQKKLGLVPLEYLELEEKPPNLQSSSHGPPSVTPIGAAVQPIGAAVHPVQQELHGSDTQTQYGTVSADHVAPISSTIHGPVSHPSYPPSYPSPPPSHYPSNAHFYTTNNEVHHHIGKTGKKIEAAGLGVAAAGAAAGIASYVHETQSQTSSTQPPASDAAAAASAQQPPVTENVTVNQQYDPTQNTYDTTNLTQNNYDTTNNLTQNNSNYDTTNLTQNNNNNYDTTNLTQNNNNNYDTTNLTQNNNNYDTTNNLTQNNSINNNDTTNLAQQNITTPIDISAYSSSPFLPDPLTAVGAIDPYFAVPNPALVTGPDLNSASAAATSDAYTGSLVNVDGDGTSDGGYFGGDYGDDF